MIRHVLVTTDGSACALVALPVAAGLAAACGAQTTVAYVLPDPLGTFEGPYSRDYGRSYAQALAQGRAALEGAAEVLGPGTQTALLDGRGRPVAACLLDAARGSGADVIVMATHGRGPLGRLLLGSVAEAVLRHAEVPVLLVRGDVAAGKDAAAPGSAHPTAGEPCPGP